MGCVPLSSSALSSWFLLVCCFFFAFLFLVSWSSCPWWGPPCGVCAAVLCCVAVLVVFGSLVRSVVSLLAVLHAAWSAFFFSPWVPCFLVRCCASVLSFVCVALCWAALVSRCLVRCWAASCSAVVMSSVGVRCAAFPGALPCRPGPFLCCGVPPCAAFLFAALLLWFVALSLVLAPCPCLWRWHPLWHFLWCVALFLLFDAWRSPAQDYTNLLNCEVPRRTAAIYSKTVQNSDIRCQRHFLRKP